MYIFNKIRSERGVALFIALMLMLMLSIIGMGIIHSTNDEISIAGNELNEMKVFYAAEAGLDKALAAIQTEYENSGNPPEDLPADTIEVSNIEVEYTTSIGDTITKILTKGSLAGLNAKVRPFTTISSSYDPVHSSHIKLEETIEVALVPLFQFGVFYETDLEIAPGPSMTLNGRVHSNANVYIQANNSLRIDSYLTAVGDIYHGRKPGSGYGDSNGEVEIKGADGSYYSMRDGGDWLDSQDSYWFDSASTRWGGRVQDASFGQEKLNLPIANPDDPSTIIERASYDGGNEDSFENQATFKIIDGVAKYDNGATWVDVTANLIASGALVETTFRDRREGKDVTAYDIDMSIFKESGYFPSNGIMYTADNRSGYRATRIYNADEILNASGDNDQGFTLATENVVYTLGDINTNNKIPMAIISDALTILSNDWDDANSALDKSNRLASNTEVNFSYITGNTETGGGNYNGGLENLPHFLEKWSGDTLTYRGSMINLWLSEQAVAFPGEYSPPYRDWAFDNDLSDPDKMPPGTPTVRTFIRLGWKQSDVGYADLLVGN